MMTLKNYDALYVTGIETAFQKTSFISSMDADTAWRASRRLWISMYACAPDYFNVDLGTNFNGKWFTGRAEIIGTIVKIAPTEAPDQLRTVGTGLSYLMAVYSELCIVMPDNSKEDRLSISFRATYDTSSSRPGICTRTMVYGTSPTSPGSEKWGLMINRALIARSCTDIVTDRKARQALREGQKIRDVPSGEDIEKPRAFRPGHMLIVYSDHSE